MGRLPSARIRTSGRRGGLEWVAVLLLAVLAGAGSAQEVNWRSDYNEARKEALDKQRPLIIDFGTDNCFWCVKLENSTFHDPGIVSLLNEQFIPLKVMAQDNTQLTEALRIHNFPTLVLAAPDGKILANLEGYKDPSALQTHLQEVLALVSSPAWMIHDYQEAVQALAAANYARAVSLLKNLVDDRQERPIQPKARQLLQEVEQRAAEVLNRAKQLQEKGENAKAIEAATELVRTFPGTRSAGEGSEFLSTLVLKPEAKAELRSRQAKELLTQAREDYRNRQYLCCLERCEQLGASFGDLPEGTEAMQLLAEIKSNPEWLQQACDNLGGRLGNLYISLADTWMKKGQPHQAEIYLEKVIQAFPSTPQAETALARLAQIRGEPATQQAASKKE